MQETPHGKWQGTISGRNSLNPIFHRKEKPELDTRLHYDICKETKAQIQLPFKQGSFT